MCAGRPRRQPALRYSRDRTSLLAFACAAAFSAALLPEQESLAQLATIDVAMLLDQAGFAGARQSCLENAVDGKTLTRLSHADWRLLDAAWRVPSAKIPRIEPYVRMRALALDQRRCDAEISARPLLAWGWPVVVRFLERLGESFHRTARAARMQKLDGPLFLSAISSGACPCTCLCTRLCACLYTCILCTPSDQGIYH